MFVLARFLATAIALNNTSLITPPPTPAQPLPQHGLKKLNSNLLWCASGESKGSRVEKGSGETGASREKRLSRENILAGSRLSRAFKFIMADCANRQIKPREILEGTFKKHFSSICTWLVCSGKVAASFPVVWFQPFVTPPFMHRQRPDPLHLSAKLKKIIQQKKKGSEKCRHALICAPLAGAIHLIANGLGKCA